MIITVSDAFILIGNYECVTYSPCTISSERKAKVEDERETLRLTWILKLRNIGPKPRFPTVIYALCAKNRTAAFCCSREHVYAHNLMPGE